jgi:hypothetical protein
LALSDEDEVVGFVVETVLVFVFDLFSGWRFAVEGP